MRIFLKYKLIIVLILIISDFSGGVSAESLEETISGRKSFRHTYTNQKITQSQTLDILNAAYGKTRENIWNTPPIGGNYPLSIFILNDTATYLYQAETNSIVLHNEYITKNEIVSGWASEASSIFVIVWDRMKEKNQYYASAEAGCVVQKVYLKARSVNLGTICVGSINSRGFRETLGLAEHMTPLLMMPIGYTSEPYPPSSPDYSIMVGNLQPVLYSNSSLDEALENNVYHLSSHEKLSSQELSQILWAAYGYSNTTHRTTPSAYGQYPLLIHYTNQTSTYRYHPDNHSISTQIHDDKREELLISVNEHFKNIEVLSIFVLSLNVVHEGGTGDGKALFSDVDHEFIEVDVGCVIQNIFLEAKAWGLEPSILVKGLEEWNGTGANNIRNVLNLRITTIPLYIVTVNARYPSIDGTEIPELELKPESEPRGRIPSFPIMSIFAALVIYYLLREYGKWG